MKQLLILLCLCTISVGFGQDERKDSSQIQNSKTSTHIHISGTKLSIIPPSGFKIATAFTGLEKGESALIQVYDLVGGNFYTNANKFTKERFEKSGVTVFDYQEMTINGYSGKYIHLQGNPDKKGISLVFGDETFTAMIMALYIDNSDNTAEQIKDALFSSVYEKDLPIDPFETAVFNLDDSNTKFKYAKSAANTFIYSINGSNELDANRDSIMVVLPFPADASMTAKSIAEQMIGSLRNNGLSEIKILSTSNNALNNYPAYQIKMEGKLNGSPSKLLVQTVTHGENAVVFKGFLKEKSNAVIEDFEALIKTLRMK